MNRPTNTAALRPPAESDTAALDAVDRAAAELRRGGAVVIYGPTPARAVLARAAETIDTWPVPGFETGVGTPCLVVTGRRAAILGLSQPGARAVQLGCGTALSHARVRALI